LGLKPAPLHALHGVLDGRDVRVAGIGGPFPATAAAVDRARRALQAARGFDLALLFASSGAPSFEPLGLLPLPAAEAACRTRMPVPWPKEPAWVEGGDPFASVAGLRPFRPDDRPALSAIHEASARGRFFLRRDAAGWDRVLAGAGPGGPRAARGRQVWVIDAGGGAEAYVILDAGPEALRWREHGARPGAEARLVDFFWAALSAGRRAGARRLEGWHLPPAVTAASLYPVSRRARAEGLPMIGGLDPAIAIPVLRSEEDCPIGELDAF
jgi:hypothetical protein